MLRYAARCMDPNPPAPERLPLPVHLVPWVLAGLAEVALAWGALARPSLGQVALELAGLIGLGALQWWKAPAGALRNPAWAGLLLLVAGGWAHAPPDLLRAFLYAAGLVGFAFVGARVIPQSAVLSGILAVVAGLGARVLSLGAGDVLNPRTQLIRELTPQGQGDCGDGPPLLLITLDTLRWDHAVDMRSVQRLADGGTAYPRAMATSSWTLPSMVSIHTGLDAAEHGAGAWPGGRTTRAPVDAPVLAEQLRDAGYCTQAVLTNPYLTAEMGLQRGLDRVVHVNERAPQRLALLGWPWGPRAWQGELVVDRAVDWLGDLPERGWFVWVHLLDAHLPHTHAPEGSPSKTWRSAEVRSGRLFSDAEREAVRQSYAGEVAYVDDQVNRLLDAVQGRDPLVILAADHGEELWEHGDVEHGHTHHSQVVDVPIVLSWPGVAGPGVASLIDVAPTLRAAAGLDPGGIDLLQGVPADRVAMAFGNKYVFVDRSARQGDQRVIVDQHGAWRSDVDELHVAPAGFEDPLVGALQELNVVTGGRAAELNADALRALGYVDP